MIKKGKKRITITLEKKYVKELESWKGYTKSEAIENIIDFYLEENKRTSW